MLLNSRKLRRALCARPNLKPPTATPCCSPPFPAPIVFAEPFMASIVTTVEKEREGSTSAFHELCVDNLDYCKYQFAPRVYVDARDDDPTPQDAQRHIIAAIKHAGGREEGGWRGGRVSGWLGTWQLRRCKGQGQGQGQGGG